MGGGRSQGFSPAWSTLTTERRGGGRPGGGGRGGGYGGEKKQQQNLRLLLKYKRKGWENSVCQDRKEGGFHSDAQGSGSMWGEMKEATPGGGGRAGGWRPYYEFTVAAGTRDRQLGGRGQQRRSLTVPEAGSPASRGQRAGSGEGPHLTARSRGQLAALQPPPVLQGREVPPSVCPCVRRTALSPVSVSVLLDASGHRSHGCRTRLLQHDLTFWLHPRRPCRPGAGRGQDFNVPFWGGVIQLQHLRSKNPGSCSANRPVFPHLQPRPLCLWRSPLPMTRPVRPSICFPGA